MKILKTIIVLALVFLLVGLLLVGVMSLMNYSASYMESRFGVHTVVTYFVIIAAMCVLGFFIPGGDSPRGRSGGGGGGNGGGDGGGGGGGGGDGGGDGG